VLAAALATTACAPLPPGEPHVGRARLQLSPGEWVPLAQEDTVFDVRPDDLAHDLPMRSRLLGLRDADGQLVASVWVQTNATSTPRDPVVLWQEACPPQSGVQVQDAAQGSPVRIDCLRYRRRADADGYLAASRPRLAVLAAEHHALPAQPYSHVSYRYSTAEGGFISVDVLADRRLLRAPRYNNLEFLRAAPPAQAWMEQLRTAAQASPALLDGLLALPPFPSQLVP